MLINGRFVLKKYVFCNNHLRDTMKKLLLMLGLLLTLPVLAEELPKDSYGKYGGKMPAYTVEKDGVMLNIDSHDLYITIDDENITYIGGELELKGTYTVLKQSKNEYLIKSQLDNGKSLHYELEFIWNKKENTLYIAPKNGQSEVFLERMDG